MVCFPGEAFFLTMPFHRGRPLSIAYSLPFAFSRLSNRSVCCAASMTLLLCEAHERSSRNRKCRALCFAPYNQYTNFYSYTRLSACAINIEIRIYVCRGGGGESCSMTLLASWMKLRSRFLIVRARREAFRYFEA